MALEALFFQQAGQINYYDRDFSNLSGANCDFSDHFLGFKQEENLPEVYPNHHQHSLFVPHYPSDDIWSSPPAFQQWLPIQVQPPLEHPGDGAPASEEPPRLLALPEEAASSPRPKSRRRRSKGKKNVEEIENQRMTHIAVERNRRKQMNEYLSVLRSLMPDSYVPRGDQASIVGGAINYVKELEQQLQFLDGQKHLDQRRSAAADSSSALPFSDFFTFPQYSSMIDGSTLCNNNNSSGAAGVAEDNNVGASIADVEVTMVESHANLKIRSRKRPKQLLKVVSGLHSLRLTILHLNVATSHHVVLYSISVKVEDDCRLNSVDEIATAVYEMIGRIQEEAAFVC